MSKKDEVIKKIKKGYTAAAIASDLNISMGELYLIINQLKSDNIYYYPNIVSSADIVFSKNKEPLDSDVNLTLSDGEFSFVAISDTHIGNIYDSLNRFDSLTDFIYDNEIKLLVNNGDLIDGPEHDNQSVEKRLPYLEDQIDEFTIKYPYIEGANVCVLGDHDTEYRTSDGYNIYKAIKDYRPDIKVFGNASGIIKINNKEILLCHNVKDPNVRSRLTDDRIILSGHSHIYYNHTTNGSFGPAIKVVVPSISNLPLHNNTTPGFLKITLTFKSYQLVGVLIDNYTFEGRTNHILYNGSIPYQFSYKNNNEKVRKRK